MIRQHDRQGRGTISNLALATLISTFALVNNAQAGTVTLSVPKLEAKAGAAVDVPIDVQGGKGMRALQVVLTYDPAVLEVVKDASDPSKSFTKGRIAPDNVILYVYATTIPPPPPAPGSEATAQATPVKAGRLPVMFVGGPDPAKKVIYAVEQDGTLVTIHFRVIGSGGQRTALGLERAQAFGADGMDVLVKAEPGELSVVRAFNPWWPVAAAGGLILLLMLWRAARRDRHPTASRERNRDAAS